MNTPTTPSIFATPRALWTQRREAALNWLALGLLLAAWNAADPPAGTSAARHPAQIRPPQLRGYCCVSVRAAQRALPLPASP